MSSHSLTCSHKNTESFNFPRMLAIGREPNCDIPFNSETGPYDFDSTNMRAIRESITLGQIDAHVDDFLSKAHILNRTKLVILSGHRSGVSGATKNIFHHASSRIEQKLDNKNIAHISTRIFIGNNQAAILTGLRSNAAATACITDILNEFSRIDTSSDRAAS